MCFLLETFQKLKQVFSQVHQFISFLLSNPWIKTQHPCQVAVESNSRKAVETWAAWRKVRLLRCQSKGSRMSGHWNQRSKYKPCDRWRCAILDNKLVNHAVVIGRKKKTRKNLVEIQFNSWMANMTNQKAKTSECSGKHRLFKVHGKTCLERRSQRNLMWHPQS